MTVALNYEIIKKNPQRTLKIKTFIDHYEESKVYHEQKVCCICKKEFNTDDNDKVRDHSHFTGKYRGAAHNVCNLNYKGPKEIPVVFHNGSIYDYHFKIKELAEEFKGQYECLIEITEKYITFSVPVKTIKNYIQNKVY